MHTQHISLICFPHAGGSNATYNGWGSLLSETIERIKPRCFDRPSQRGEFTDVDALSAHIAEQLSHESRPLALYGHSMGAVLAYEVARRLSIRNTVQVLHLFVSGRRAPQLPARLTPIHELSDQAFLDELRAYGGVPDAIGTNSRLLSTLIPIIRSDLALVETYQFHPAYTLKCPISAIYATDDPVIETEELRAWQERTTSDFYFHKLSGNHFFHCSRPKKLIDIIHQSLSMQSTGRAECKNCI